MLGNGLSQRVDRSQGVRPDSLLIEELSEDEDDAFAAALES